MKGGLDVLESLYCLGVGIPGPTILPSAPVAVVPET